MTDLYSLKMRASKHTPQGEEHVSGAEKIICEQEIPGNMQSLLSRALHHAKGRADFINMKIEAVAPQEIEYLDALPVSTISVDTPEAGRARIVSCLQKLGIKNGEAIMKLFQDTYGMRGAMLLNVDTLERLEPDQERGIRATYMDAEHLPGRDITDHKNHFQEAIVLATKVVHAPHILAEICMSDDPDYVTGYVAAPSLGYVRITKLKPWGCPDGGRIFLFKGTKGQVPECIHYLEQQRVLVRRVPGSPSREMKDHAAAISQSQKSGGWEMMSRALAAKEQDHCYRRLQELSSAQSSQVLYQGRKVLMLASNNYLGLVDNAQVKQAAIRAVEKYGCGSGGSRLTTGTMPLHTELEKQLADFKQTEAALLFNTGYMANVGIISAVCRPGSVIYSDELNHASIIDGCRLSRAQIVVYRHQDLADLESKILEHRDRPGLIVTDAVFSMDGDIAALPGIMSLARKYHVMTMVDEAHSTGVIGRTGRGICEYYQLEEQPDILMGTLSKSLGSEGGYACGRKLLIEYLRNTARSFIFSTSQSPANVASALAALLLLRQEPARVQRLQENSRFFSEALKAQGLNSISQTAIIPILVGDEDKAAKLAQHLLDEGIFISAIRYPTVAKGEARLRAAIMATHTQAELGEASAKIAAAFKELV